MSFIDKVVGVVTGVAEGIAEVPGDIWKAIRRAWRLAEGVWSFLVQGYGILDDAWNWMVHGVEWLGGNIDAWAGEVFNTVWHTLTSTIPGAIAWVFDQAVKWAYKVASRVYHELRSFAESILHFLTKLIHELVHAVKSALTTFIRWATAPIRWVLHWGAWLIHLITHPGNLANWIASAILEPVVKWFIKAGADVIVWILRRVASRNSGFVHLIEQVLHDLL